jgi:uncharacterized protein YbjT (DUF2867 family)
LHGTSPILVTGATGNTGRAVVQALACRGVTGAAMVRAEADRGRLPARVEVAVADFDDPASLAAALRGAGRAYLVIPSSERAEAQQRRFADLAVQAGVGHLVVLSQLGADEQSPVRFLRYHAAVERHIRDLGTGYTFLRPNLFFQGLLAFARTIAADSRFYAPIGDAAISAVDVRDIDVPPDAFAESLQGILPPGRSRVFSRTTRTTGAGRRHQSPLRSLRSPAGPQPTSCNSHTTTQAFAA